MIFRAGPTYDEVERKQEQWCPWFAWFPVRIGQRHFAWLQTVERRKATSYEFNGIHRPWYYRLDASSDTWCRDWNITERQAAWKDFEDGLFKRAPSGGSSGVIMNSNGTEVK